jgi:hypothetical protein
MHKQKLQREMTGAIAARAAHDNGTRAEPSARLGRENWHALWLQERGLKHSRSTESKHGARAAKEKLVGLKTRRTKTGE